MKNDLNILRIAVASALRQSFDYLPPLNCDLKILKKGLRLLVPFGHRKLIGILLACDVKSDVDVSKLKRVCEICDKEPLFTESIFALCAFASEYYHHPLGDVLLKALPRLLRSEKRLPQNVLSILTANRFSGFSTSRKPKCEGYIDSNDFMQLGSINIDKQILQLNSEQKQAICAICENLNRDKVFLLDGITGSGKTEVYLRVIEMTIQNGKQALVLVPEISLTPQTVARFTKRFPHHNITVFHSRLSDKERLAAWWQARQGMVQIIIGTRSALFTPLHKPGVIIIDEEHDLSFKQHSGLRYSARNLAVMRSKLEKIPLILGSATPSFESINNAHRGRYIHLILSKRVGGSKPPSFHLVDIRNQRLKSGLALSVIENMEKHLAQGGQILIFVDRRGFAPSLLCHQCGWIAQCVKCDVRLTLHRKPQSLCCHHCSSIIKVPERCPICSGNELVACGIGTERLEMGLKKLFPTRAIARIDSDSTRKKGAMQKIIKDASDGHSKILVGTQMLSKGHHFPTVTMVIILNADHGLYSADFRASEYLAQLIVQVSGRAGRADKPGEVYIQTHHPDHPLLLNLVHAGYDSFAKASMLERFQAELPPFSHMVLIRAQSKTRSLAHEFLKDLRDQSRQLKETSSVQILGPVAAAIERKADRFHAMLLLQSKKRKALHDAIIHLLKYAEKSSFSRRGKWSIDVDPVEILS